MSLSLLKRETLTYLVALDVVELCPWMWNGFVQNGVVWEWELCHSTARFADRWRRCSRGALVHRGARRIWGRKRIHLVGCCYQRTLKLYIHKKLFRFLFIYINLLMSYVLLYSFVCSWEPLFVQTRFWPFVKRSDLKSLSDQSNVLSLTGNRRCQSFVIYRLRIDWIFYPCENLCVSNTCFLLESLIIIVLVYSSSPETVSGSTVIYWFCGRFLHRGNYYA